MRPIPSAKVLARPRFEFYIVGGLILLLALWVRLTHLYGLPIFFDESDHIVWAQRFSVQNNTYPFLMDGKFLLGVLLAQFRILGPAPLWLARSAVVVFSLISCAACIAIGRLLGSSRGGLLAGLLYAVLPQAVFFERQTFADPLMSCFGLAAVVCMLRLAAKPRFGWVVPIAFFLGGSFLFKLFGLIYLAFPAAALFLPASWKERNRLVILNAAAIGLAVLLVAGSLFFLRAQLGYNDEHLTNQQVGFVGCPAIICQLSPGEQLKNLTTFGGALAETVSLYIGWPTVILALLAWPLSAPDQRRKLFFFYLGAAGMLGLFALTAKGYVPPRYLGFLAAPVMVLAALALVSLANRFRVRAIGVSITGALLLLITFWPSSNLVPLVLAFERAQLTNIDRQVYVWPWTGPGIRDAAFAVWNRTEPEALPPVVLSPNIYIHLVGAYFDRTRVDVRSTGEAYPADIGRWLLDGQPIYLFEGLPAGETPGLLTEEIDQYPHEATEGPTVSLRQVTGADASLRANIYTEFFPRPDKLAAEYEALVASLPGDKAATLLVYPPNQIEALTPLLTASHPNITVAPIGDSWPLDTTTAADQLAQLTAGSQPVFAAFVEETKGDPQRFLETWLTTHLFRLNEQWFGPVRLVAFAPNAPASQSVTVGGQFGDAIVLDSIDLLETEAPPGGLVRLRIRWQALAPIAQQFKVFTHLFAGERIIAQHDGQPVGELRPTTTWQMGETITDQFAIQLPPDAPPGSYQLRIGLYEIETQARLPLLLPDGSTNEFFVGGEIVIR